MPASNVMLLAGVALLAAAACATSSTDPIGPEAPLFDPGAPDAADASCSGRSCQRVTCRGAPTTLRGRVLDPAGKRPVYGAAVYVPNGDIPRLAPSTSCRRCSDVLVDAAASALTDDRGEFVLEDVPVLSGLPVVVELGSFRRVLTVDVAPCSDQTLPDERLRLPRVSSEGDLPRIAVTTGGADALECLFRGIGILDQEFVPGGSPEGHVQVYRGAGGGGLAGRDVPDASTFWNDATRLATYDLVALSCEGEEALASKGGETPGARGAMHAYASSGGHVFATHFQRVWLEDSPFPDFEEIAEWGGAAVVGTTYDVEQSFPKGAAFAKWLVNVGASQVRGAIDLANVTYSVGATRVGAQPWIRRGAQAVRFFSFNTPLGAAPEAQCGRVVFGDLHVSAKGGGDLPLACPVLGTELTPEQLALEFLLFDALSCVRDDREAPTPPR
ncbi:MAG: Tryptophan synthase alpha chain [Labilithrix sp.]|nr:Tryptophan synthase alpha chain [Labilithrix sp.]